ncbi:MAG: TonB-dependent receptor plug domain-containing protein [Rubrimonas sp.]|uniref:TonB-dependent receptor plug domain-containing protein n=1 Tax=Rubrimonas sp. TaxID=2036015 RepID=UPI002FDDF495
MRASSLIAAVAASFTLSYPALGQTPVLLDEIVVGGGLAPVAAQSYARAATIVTGEELRARGISRLVDALRGTPGVSVSRVGGPGGETSVRIRGSESNHVLVLIDGVEAAGAATAFDFSRLSADEVERVEVLRGPQAAVYGAGATAGVINIITRGGAGADGLRTFGFAEAGTNPSGGVGAGLEYGGPRGAGALSLTFRDDAGWDARGGGSGDDDGAQALVFNARGGVSLTDEIGLRGSFRYVDREGEFDNSRADQRGENDGRDLFAGLAADWAMLDGALVHTPSVSYAFSDTDTRTFSFDPSFNDEDTLKAGYQLAYSFGPARAHTVIGALQYKREGFENGFVAGGERSRDEIGYVLDYRAQITEALFVQAGARYDDNEEFDDFLSWSLSASYQIFDTGTRLRASVGRAQTNPDFFQQFGFIFGTFEGNPDLKPERNFGWDVGVDQTFWGGRALISATYFDESLEDEIVSVGLGGGVQSVGNLDDDSTRRGVELSGSVAPIDGLTLGASYTWLDAEDDAGAQEIRRPEHSGAVSARYRFLEGRAHVGGEAVFAAETTDSDFSTFPASTVDLDDYVVINLDAGYRVTEQVELYGAVRNLFDADYEEVFGYRAEPLTALVGLRASF